MKKILLSMVTVLMVLGACKDEEKKAPITPNEPTENKDTLPPAPIVVTETNTGLVNKFTGSLCGPCGSWGWEAFDKIMADNGKNAIYMGTYSQNFVAQLFITQTATDMDANMQSQGYPTFAANGVCQLDRTNGVNVESELNKVNAVLTAHKAAAVAANSGFRTKIENDEMTIETKTKFFQAGVANAEYYVAVYLMENDVVGYQYGHPDGSNTHHHHVLRGSAQLTGSSAVESYGYKIPMTTIPAGQEFENTFKISTKGYNKDNLEVAVVIWRKIGIRYKFVNAFSNQ